MPNAQQAVRLSMCLPLRGLRKAGSMHPNCSIRVAYLMAFDTL